MKEHENGVHELTIPMEEEGHGILEGNEAVDEDGSTLNEVSSLSKDNSFIEVTENRKEEDNKSVPVDDVPSALTTYNCGKCAFSSEAKEKLNEHIDSNHSTRLTNSFKCEVCEKVFESNTELLVHFDNEHENDFLRCHLCAKI